jgi:hypothetical protein
VSGFRTDHRAARDWRQSARACVGPSHLSTERLGACGIEPKIRGSGRRMNSKMFHQRAQECLRLAAECPDLYAQEALMELAAEFEQMSRQLDEDAQDFDRMESRRRSGEASHR